MRVWNLSSRIHPLNHFPDAGVTCFVKRDDELGCGISGSKLRKYASLIPYLLEKGIQHLIIIAGPQSNNLLAALQMAREFKLQVTAFLIKPWNTETKGNFKLSRLFLEDKDIVWVERKEWCDVEKNAKEYLHTLNVPAFVLSEGASVPAAMTGAMTLAEDIIHNEHQLGLSFQHVFVDAGSGFTASALIKGFAEHQHKALIHVLLLADDESQFNKKLTQWTGEQYANYDCFYPSTAKAFGAINQGIKNEVNRMAYEEGILADPIYSAKLFYEVRKKIEVDRLQGTLLIIHSGGTLTMPAFDYQD